MEVTYSPLGDRAVVIEVADAITPETQNRVQVLSSYFDEHPPGWMIEYIPAFTTVTVFYDILKVSKNTQHPYKKVCEELDAILSSVQGNRQFASRTIEIPVCYGGEFGPDLEFVAKHNGIQPEDVIDIHTSGDYTINMIGFAPGFPFVGGMPEEIATPRRDSPRLAIPERTVGIAGKQTGVYPIETPGGWQLIGRTPIRLFRPELDPPSLLAAGDKLVFRSISLEEYSNWEEHD
ncbi:kinase inhibitor [Virgibacillus phasianinus]|uniref:Kinase inhibitor n=1 Tax=Virgibacillus phasianinus TaxID=2017483 RepID=A0A220U2R8_9BACI|nr:5-oxoprolinase subunit PxpB [Virgibacillus phasianinus]ASK62429.1 kinase inhibitor [Virgibacillus phasianinus]